MSGEKPRLQHPYEESLLFFFFLTLVTGPRRSLSLELSDTRVDAPQIRSRLDGGAWGVPGAERRSMGPEIGGGGGRYRMREGVGGGRRGAISMRVVR